MDYVGIYLLVWFVLLVWNYVLWRSNKRLSRENVALRRELNKSEATRLALVEDHERELNAWARLGDGKGGVR